jgi:Protein of unknown function (DUF2586)
MRDDIVFIKGQGASGRTAPGKDFISGLLFFANTLPSGFSTTANTKLLNSIIDAETLGIKSNYNDATAATATITIVEVGDNGDSINVIVDDSLGTHDLGTYIKTIAETSEVLEATVLASVINGNTKNNGYSATSNAGVVTIYAPKYNGIFLNSGTHLNFSANGAIGVDMSSTQFTGGVASKQAVWHYHISEFFRANQSGQLWVGFYPVPSTYTFSEITLLQTAAAGDIRQIGIYKDGAAYNATDLTTIDSEIKTNNDATHKPLSALYAADLHSVSDITTIADLSLLSANKCSSIIGQDGAGYGAFLYKTTGKSITHLGIALGMLSKSAVSEDFGEPSKFNISDGIENAVPAFANGKLLSDPSFTSNSLDVIDSKRHIFGQMYVGIAGTFFNENHCAITTASDYAFINDNRVIDKAIRGVYAALIPYLKAKLLKNADGTLAATTISFFQTVALKPLFQMARDQDLGEVTKDDVYINPSQNVTATNTLIINIKLNENGIARNIQIPISFK